MIPWNTPNPKKKLTHCYLIVSGFPSLVTLNFQLVSTQQTENAAYYLYNTLKYAEPRLTPKINVKDKVAD